MDMQNKDLARQVLEAHTALAITGNDSLLAELGVIPVADKSEDYIDSSDFVMKSLHLGNNPEALPYFTSQSESEPQTGLSVVVYSARGNPQHYGLSENGRIVTSLWAHGNKKHLMTHPVFAVPNLHLDAVRFCPYNVQSGPHDISIHKLISKNHY